MQVFGSHCMSKKSIKNLTVKNGQDFLDISYSISTTITILFGNIHVDKFIQLQTKFDLIEKLHKERERQREGERERERDREGERERDRQP